MQGRKVEERGRGRSEKMGEGEQDEEKNQRKEGEGMRSGGDKDGQAERTFDVL